MASDYQMTPEDLAEQRIDPLFDLFLRFEKAFCRLAIDRYNITDEEAELAAKKMQAGDDTPPMSDAFAALLRQIQHARIIRRLHHMLDVIMLADGGLPDGGMSIPEIHERYASLTKGDAKVD